MIEKCLKGGAAHDILREMEEELPDLKSIHHHLHKDLKYAGVNLPMSSIRFEDTSCQVNVPPKLSSSKSIIETVLDVYRDTYPELEFFAKFITETDINSGSVGP